MNKLVIASLAASVMLVSFSASQAANPAGPTEMASAAPAALCGPGYTVKSIGYTGPNGGVVKSYHCERTIPDARPCNKGMQIKNDDLKFAGNNLKLGYGCSLPEG
ncbi:MAG: hypothetical protein ABI821_06775 [Pseudomonadota bacterium]